MSEQSCGCDKQPCGCCEGVQQLTPANECNRPGLGAISYRVGTHGQFLASMKARLSTMEVEVDSADGQTQSNLRPLQNLKTRDQNDFSIALLDSWATVGDVMSFYQERIANEGYLRTATERRSVLEMANLVGYTLRPGVASSVYLAYTIDDKQLEPTTIPAGARSQSIPGPGELPQSFETSEDLEARAGWNTLKPRLSRPQTQESINGTGSDGRRVYLQGINTNLKVNDPLLIDFGIGSPTVCRALQVTPESGQNRTLVIFSDWLEATNTTVGSTKVLVAKENAAGGGAYGMGMREKAIDPLIGLMKQLTLPPSIPPRNTLTMARDIRSTFTQKANIGSQMATTFQPILQSTFTTALANSSTTPSNQIRVYALRAKASLFGSNLPGKPNYSRDPETGMISITDYTEPSINNTFGNLNETLHSFSIVALDREYDRISVSGWVAIDRPSFFVDGAGSRTMARAITTHLITDVKTTAISAFGAATKSTQLTISPEWLKDLNADQLRTSLNSTSFLRGTSVFTQSEELMLADEPYVEDICNGADSWIELDGYYSELKSGRWVIVSGQRSDITVSPNNGPVLGVYTSELVMLSNVVQDVSLFDGTPSNQYVPPPVTTYTNLPSKPPSLPGEKLHTFIRFAKNLEYCYSRDNVTIYGNVVKATHGETRNETLGNGDGSKELQSFILKPPPLTFVAAPTPAGADSTLKAYVNDVEWHEKDSLAWFGAKDHVFTTSTNDAGNTSLTFGNGEHGARLPTGLLNVKAIYRNGIGRAGDVRAEQISLLQSRPLGVKAVINPMRASGGTDKESRDLARENAPLSVVPLDRLVSVQDYADFTRRFAGIAKALAQKTSDGHRELVYLTIAGVDDAPIDTSSDLYRNLLDALRLYGDPDLPLRVTMRELEMLVLSAKIKILPDFLWEKVVSDVRNQLLAAFGFDRRALGQPVRVSEVISCIQNVRGVAYVDVDAFGAVPEKVEGMAPDGSPIRRLITPDEIISTVQFVIDPDSVTKILHSRAAKDRLPKNVDVWAGGSDGGVLRPAELAIFTPAVPDTLILNQKS